MQNGTHYKVPQRVTPSGLALGGLAAVAGAIILAPVYAYATVYIPFIYINLILTGAFGAAVGYMIAAALRAGHFQNTLLSYAAVSLSALLAYWTHWIWWFSALAFRFDMDGFSAIPLLLPWNLLDAVVSINDIGTWTLRSSSNVSGTFLAIVWLAEAIAFFGAALFAAASLIGTGTYCTRCKAWCKAVAANRIATDPSLPLAEAINTRQEWSLLYQPMAPSDATAWHAITVEGCAQCGETHTLTVTDTHVTFDKKGKEHVDQTVTVDRIYISKDAVRELEAAWDAPPQDSTPDTGSVPVAAYGAPPWK